MARHILSIIYNSSAREIVTRLSRRFRGENPVSQRVFDSARGELEAIFTSYTTDHLVGISKDAFKDHIHSRLGEIDAEIEGYSSAEIYRQRDLSIKFHWGHDHDFGDFRIEGLMGDRHIRLLATFVASFPLSLRDFEDQDVFDVGCWTGGTTLSLAGLGARVFAVEEVSKYAAMTEFLVRSFGLEEVTVETTSLYACDREDMRDRFDIVYVPGVIYHLSDPVLGLRIMFNSLKIGGSILVESMGLSSPDPHCRFEGSLVHHKGTKDDLSRMGWAWFAPSPSALRRFLREAGFDDDRAFWHEGRVFGYGRKTAQVGICRAGLSVPDIP